MSRTVAIIQARMGSTRFPGKVLEPIEGRPMLGRVVDRVRAADRLDEVVVATSSDPGDDAIVTYCKEESVRCIRGPEEDVLDRFHTAARRTDADDVVRVTADCPLIDPAVVDRVAESHRERNADYTSNTLDRTYPDGLDVEAFTVDTLVTAWENADRPSDREHVTSYIWNRPDRFTIAQVRHDEDRSRYRWTVDHPEDLDYIRRIYAALDDPLASMDAVIEAVEAAGLDPGGPDRPINEGFTRSLEEEGR